VVIVAFQEGRKRTCGLCYDVDVAFLFCTFFFFFKTSGLRKQTNQYLPNGPNLCGHLLPMRIRPCKQVRSVRAI
jgi:hypothetical protein